MSAGVEFAGELTDWIQTDLKRVDADRVRDMKYGSLHMISLLVPCCRTSKHCCRHCFHAQTC